MIRMFIKKTKNKLEYIDIYKYNTKWFIIQQMSIKRRGVKMLGMKHAKRVIKKQIAVLLIIMNVIGSMGAGSITAYAQAPKAKTDEALYINLDYYGETKDINIVKGVSLNGQSSYTDYGSYSSVVNMTSDQDPVLASDSVSFSDLDTSKRFYYQCTPKSSSDIVLPWTFDVDYKLNGVTTTPEKIAGASGLVEIHLKATANKSAPEYMRNNMLLTVATTVDMTKNLSVEADGAQIQSLGTTDAVMFAALPGEDGDYTIRIGSDSFEYSGLIIMMVPGTADALDHVKDIKEAKDRVDDSVDKIYDSTNKLLDIMGTMDSSLVGLRSGLVDLNKARATADSYGDTLVGQSEQSIADLRDTATKTAELVPHITTAKQAVHDITIEMDQIAGDLDDITPVLRALRTDLYDIQSDLGALQDVLADASDEADDSSELAQRLYDKLSDTSQKLEILEAIIAGDSVIGTAEDGTGGVKYITSLDKSTQELYKSLLKMGYFASPSSAEKKAGYYEALQQSALSSDALYKALGELCEDGQAYIDLSQDGLVINDSALVTFQEGIAVATKSTANTKSITYNAVDMIGRSKTLLEDIVNAHETIDKYSKTTEDAIDAAGRLTISINSTMTSTADTLTTINNIFKNSKGEFNSGTKKSIESSIEVIDKALDMVKLSNDFKSANDSIKQAWDSEIDDLTKDTNVLNMDPDAALVSFTSSKNDTPNSIQVIMRTEEITADDDAATDVTDIDVELDNAGPLGRIWIVFKSIFNYIINIFSKL